MKTGIYRDKDGTLQVPDTPVMAGLRAGIKAVSRIHKEEEKDAYIDDVKVICKMVKQGLTQLLEKQRHFEIEMARSNNG